MGTQWDYIGSLVIGGIVIVIVLSISNTLTTTYHRTRDLISQEAALHLVRILEHDLYKIGYLTPGVPVVEADSTRLRFTLDVDEDGIPDTLGYVLGDTAGLSQTTNPLDKPLYRALNNEEPVGVAIGLVDFSFAYFDTGGIRMEYDSLKAERHRATIRSIEVAFKVEPAEPIDTTYIPVVIRRLIRPRNLTLW